MQLDEDGKVLTTKRHHTGEDIRMMHAEETKTGALLLQVIHAQTYQKIFAMPCC